MEPHEYTQLIETLLDDATHRLQILAEAARAKQKEIDQITASQHITDDEPNAQPVYTVQEELESWEKIVRALTEIQAELEKSNHRNRITG
jgi:hypothetical protein